MRNGPRSETAIMRVATCAVIATLALPIFTFAESYYDHSMWYSADGNLALNKRVVQSSTGFKGLSTRAVDGGFSQRYHDGTCSHTKQLANQNSWLTVDLGESKDVQLVHLTPRADCCTDRYDSLEVRVGDIDATTSDSSDANPVCEAIDGAVDESGVKTLFRCSSAGRYVTLRLSQPDVALTVCEVMVFDFEKKPKSILHPKVLGDGTVPVPLRDAVGQYVDSGMAADDATLKAFMEGPINCGDKGFFCRMKEEESGVGGGMSGTPGDALLNNRNYGYCEDRATDRRINWNKLSRQPNNNDGHCHGSPFDESYIGLLQDHYYRPYRGTLHCCCSVSESIGENGDWVPVKDLISRCDYRGQDANDANKNFEGGCGADMKAFLPEASYPEEMCWTLEHFGEPVENVRESPPYSKPQLRVTDCDDDGCVVDLDSRWPRDTRLLMSTSLVQPRMVDDIGMCDEVHGVAISEYDLLIEDWKNLEIIATDSEGRLVDINITFNGCYADHRQRAFENWRGKLTMEECATEAMKEGSEKFAMQWPQRARGQDAHCWISDKRVMTEDPDARFGRRPDDECKGEDWNPVFMDKEFLYNGDKWRNAVYSVSVIDREGDSTDAVFKFYKIPGVGSVAGSNDPYNVQVLDLKTCAISEQPLPLVAPVWE